MSRCSHLVARRCQQLGNSRQSLFKPALFGVTLAVRLVTCFCWTQDKLGCHQGIGYVQFDSPTSTLPTCTVRNDMVSLHPLSQQDLSSQPLESRVSKFGVAWGEGKLTRGSVYGSWGQLQSPRMHNQLLCSQDNDNNNKMMIMMMMTMCKCRAAQCETQMCLWTDILHLHFVSPCLHFDCTSMVT